MKKGNENEESLLSRQTGIGDSLTDYCHNTQSSDQKCPCCAKPEKASEDRQLYQQSLAYIKINDGYLASNPPVTMLTFNNDIVTIQPKPLHCRKQKELCRTATI